MAAEPPEATTLIIGPALAFTAGFADASTFVGAGGIFCSHITGNFVVLAADLARSAGARADQWLKLATFPIFVVAVLTSARVHRSLGPDVAARSPRALLTVKILLFGTAAIVGGFAHASGSGPGRIAVVTLLVTAMGIQNAMHRLTPTFGPMTTVMTGNVTHWFVEALTPLTPEGARERRLRGVVIASFGVGCIVGALGVARFGFAVLVVPTAVLLFARSQIVDSPA
jgi:uncharacterized membrane protein YoaK (UPF0700 family)